MTEYEKVIKGLKCCSTPHKSCSKACPYNKDCYSEMDGEGITHLCADALKLLREQPKVVRCKDCKHYMTIHCTCDGCCISDDWFCADGEEKQE